MYLNKYMKCIYVHNTFRKNVFGGAWCKLPQKCTSSFKSILQAGTPSVLIRLVQNHGRRFSQVLLLLVAAARTFVVLIGRSVPEINWRNVRKRTCSILQPPRKYGHFGSTRNTQKDCDLSADSTRTCKLTSRREIP